MLVPRMRAVARTRRVGRVLHDHTATSLPTPSSPHRCARRQDGRQGERVPPLHPLHPLRTPPFRTGAPCGRVRGGRCWRPRPPSSPPRPRRGEVRSGAVRFGSAHTCAEKERDGGSAHGASHRSGASCCAVRCRNTRPRSRSRVHARVRTCACVAIFLRVCVGACACGCGCVGACRFFGFCS